MKLSRHLGLALLLLALVVGEGWAQRRGGSRRRGNNKKGDRSRGLPKVMNKDSDEYYNHEDVSTGVFFENRPALYFYN